MRHPILCLLIALSGCNSDRSETPIRGTTTDQADAGSANNANMTVNGDTRGSNNAQITNNAPSNGATNSDTVGSNHSTTGPTNSATGGSNNATDALFAAAEAAPDTWVWLDVPETTCRDGSTTGMGVRLRPQSNNLLIFLMGGGACFSAATCTVNPKTFGVTEFTELTALETAFFVTDPASAVQDWNHVFIPYCTGDLHTGTRVGNVPNCPLCPRNQSFVGYLNMQSYLAHLSTYFEDVDQIVFAGSSAGGYGAVYNYEQAVAAFGKEPVLINDSGPPFTDDAVFSPCFDDHIVASWGMDASLPPGCGACATSGQRLQAIAPYLATTYDAPMAFLGSERDAVIRVFANDAANRCNLPNVTADVFQAATYDLVDNTFAPSGWGTFVIDDASHVHLNSNDIVDGVALSAYLTALLAGDTANLDNRP